MGEDVWTLMNRKGPGKCLRESASAIWGKNLTNRCLDLTKVKNKIPNRSPVKICSPKKVELFLSMLNVIAITLPSVSCLGKENRLTIPYTYKNNTLREKKV